MSTSILRHGHYLVASIRDDLSDGQIMALRDELGDLVGRHRARGVIVDVSALDVIDSFFARTFQSLAVTSRLRGAETILAGIRPDVAIAMAHFDLDLAPLRTALDLDEALAMLARGTPGGDGRDR